MRIRFQSYVHEHRRQPPNLFAARPDSTGPTRLTHFSGAPAGVIGAVRAAHGTNTASAHTQRGPWCALTQRGMRRRP
jgi:hypothetical protein